MLKRWIFSSSNRFLLKNATTTKTTEINVGALKLNYGNDETMRILSIVNNSSENDLTRYQLSKARAERVAKYKEKHGTLTDLNQLLTLDGFGLKVLEKFCDSILKSASNPVEVKVKEEPGPRISQYCMPTLNEEVRKQIKTCLGVNVTVSNISWAKLTLGQDSKPMKFDTWADYPIDDRKLHLSDLVALTKRICTSMPVADAYVLETPPVSLPTLPGKNVTQINVNVQKSQLVGMTALALLYKQQDTIQPTIPSQQVFFLKNFLPSRVFRTLIGTERVSTENTVLDLLRYEYSADIGKSDLPTLAGQVTAPLNIRQFYDAADGYRRDHLGQAFLTALCFMRLCVLKCNKTLTKLENPRKQ